MTPSIITTTTSASQPPIPPTPIPSDVLQTLLTFALVFHFEDRVKSLEVNFSEFMRTNQSTEAISNIPGLVHQYMHQEMTKAIREARSDEQRNLYKALVEAYDTDKTILDSYEESAILKRRRDDDDDQEGPSAGSDRGSKRRSEGGEHASASTPSEPTTGSAGMSITGTQSRQMSSSESTFVEEPVQTTCQMEEPSHPVFETGAEDQPIIQTSQHPEWFSQPRKPPTPDRDRNKFLPAAQGNAYLTELGYHLEEVYKATTDQLDWVNPEGQQYPHNLLQPLPLILNNQGRRVISFEHFINNDLEYLWGGASSRKYTTSVTKTKEADYGHINSTGSLLTGNLLSIYTLKRRIIAVTDLKIMEWHNYKHLDWISVRRDDDKIYKFKEGDSKRLCLQDIEDMMLLLVQGKLSNLTVEERFAFNVSLRMFTRSIVIQRHKKDLQLGVESYQKRLNLTKPDTYQSDLKRRGAYTAYSNPRGFIYQNRDKKNRLMRIDKLHKFRDGTLNDVRNALDDRLKGIRIQYLPTTIWRKGDKDRAAAMIQAIDKILKTRRIMRSLERTMATTIEQQVALDDALVPSAQRSPFFKAFLITADVPEIYMQEFWATTYVHQHSIRFKMDTRKNIINLEAFREMLHISPRVPANLLLSYHLKRRSWSFFDFLDISQIISSANISPKKRRLCLSHLGRFCVSSGTQESKEKQQDVLPKIYKIHHSSLHDEETFNP
nr:hypothetical protein [Tanacetum cinerariifolium]